MLLNFTFQLYNVTNFITYTTHMANSWFAFKQFKINQDRAAMKVGTDGVLLGAWVDVEDAVDVLDIGAGTGLIALMMAQRNSMLNIDAIDIDSNACEQAKENIEASPWSGRVIVHNISLEHFVKSSSLRYDLIVCNPPYFTNSKRSIDESRRIARHTDELTLDDLFRFSSPLITDRGKLGIVYPYADFDRAVSEAKDWGLFPEKVTFVRPTADKEYVRVLIIFSKDDKVGFSENELVIETDQRHFYTEEFKSLVRDFYLQLK